VTFGISTTNTDPVLQSGLQFYKSHCISCHAIGPIGGSYSFRLNEKKTLQDKGADYVKKYVIDPVKMNPKTKMIQIWTIIIFYKLYLKLNITNLGCTKY
jgi:hypothetical protein